MNIHVATPQRNAEASRALRAEGVEFEEHVLMGEWEYGSLFYRLWALRQPFVLVEWDVIPSPGTVKALWRCERRWCTHEYHLQPGHLAHSFGIGKYRPLGSPPEEWRRTPWNLLDGAVVPHLHKLAMRPHLHTPPLAHCRRLARD
jgi:hypothetical protein